MSRTAQTLLLLFVWTTTLDSTTTTTGVVMVEGFATCSIRSRSSAARTPSRRTWPTRIIRTGSMNNHARQQRHSTVSSALFHVKGFEFSDLLYDDVSTAFDAWEWTANLGAPAALVAGAVLVTLSETRFELAPRKHDAHWVRVCKQVTRFLLLSSFALEVVSIFVSTMTGSVLLGHGPQAPKQLVGYKAPLQLLHYHHEFEYLTIQLGFLQGLLHWLAAVGLEFVVPKRRETNSARRMNTFMASCLLSLIFWIMAFYNHHLSFYSDYTHMVKRYCVLFAGRYFGFLRGGEFRPLSLLYGPSFFVSLMLGWRAFDVGNRDDDDDDDDDNE